MLLTDDRCENCVPPNHRPKYKKTSKKVASHYLSASQISNFRVASIEMFLKVSALLFIIFLKSNPGCKVPRYVFNKNSSFISDFPLKKTVFGGWKSSLEVVKINK
jgi:hypothetical protein